MCLYRGVEQIPPPLQSLIKTILYETKNQGSVATSVQKLGA
jgi:hypothetical protein